MKDKRVEQRQRKRINDALKDRRKLSEEHADKHEKIAGMVEKLPSMGRIKAKPFHIAGNSFGKETYNKLLDRWEDPSMEVGHTLHDITGSNHLGRDSTVMSTFITGREHRLSLGENDHFKVVKELMATEVFKNAYKEMELDMLDEERGM